MATNINLRKDYLLSQVIIVLLDTENNGVYDCICFDDGNAFKAKRGHIAMLGKPLHERAWQIPHVLKYLSDLGYSDINIKKFR